MSQAFKVGQTRYEAFTAPDGPVRAVAGAVGHQPNDRAAFIVFGQDRGDMGPVMLNANEGHVL